MYIAQGGILNGAKAQLHIENKVVAHTEVAEVAEVGARQHAPPKCSVCSSLEHNAHTCPERQHINS